MAALLLLPALAQAQPYTVGDGSFFQPVHYSPIRPSSYLLISAHVDRTPGPLMTLSRTVDMQGCTQGLDSTCTAPLTITVKGTPDNRVQTSGLMVLGQNDGVNGPSGTNDHAGIQSFAFLDTFSRTQVKQSVAGFFGARRDCTDSLQDCTGLTLGLGRVGALELQLANFTEHDCLITADNLTDCTGVQIVTYGNGTYGGPGRRGGIAYSLIAVTPHKDQWTIGYACAGAGRGVTGACFDDVSEAEAGLRLRGTYQRGIDLSQGTFAGAAITMPAAGGTIAGPVYFSGPVTSPSLVESVIAELLRRGLIRAP